MFPVLKIPCILATTLALHVGITSPNLPPSESERVVKIDTLMSDGFIGLFGHLHYNPVIKFCWWLAAASEIAIIVANRLPAFSSLLSVMPATFLIRNDSTGVDLTLQSIIGMIFTISGGLLRLQCYRTLGRHFTFEISIRQGHQLVTTGPYSIVRHPGYSAIFLLHIGMILWFTSGGAWLRESGVLGTLLGRTAFIVLLIPVLVIPPSLCPRARVEDDLLKDQFKQEWEYWARRVPYVLIPWVY